MDLNLNFNNFQKNVDKETGSILFYRDDIAGLPDKVIEGDGFTVEIKNNQVYLIDIFNSEKMLKHLLSELNESAA
jgi:pyrimidine operon attenuation protein/uracil phosphoribosyltransferase